MPIRDYVRSVRESLHREPSSTSAGPASQASNGDGATAGPPWALRGELPSDKIFIPDACLATLASTIFRPQDKMTGVVKALHGALGSPGGYSSVEVALWAHVRLVRTSREGTSYFPIPSGEGMINLVPRRENIDTFEAQVIKVAGETLYKYSDDGIKEGKEIILPFQLLIPSEAEGFQLAPSLDTHVRYFFGVGASEYNTGNWRDICLGGIKIRPRDDALDSIDSLSRCDPFLMISPYREFDLARQPRWILAKENVLRMSCPPASTRWKNIQRPFPLVVRLSVIAPASYGPKDADWKSFRLEIPAGDSGRHKAFTMINMQVSPARGGDGNSYERVAHKSNIHWDAVHPAPKEGKLAGGRVWELENGIDWCEPELEPATSRFAGRWASHAIVKGVLNLPESMPPTFYSRIGDLQIYNSIDLIFWQQGRYWSTSVAKVTRDLSRPLQKDAQASDGDQPPPYST